MSETLKQLKEHKHQVLKDLLSQCTEKQQLFFNRMYVSVGTIPEEKWDWAIEQCERTIKNNAKEK